VTGTFPFFKQFGGHNTGIDLAVGIPAALASIVAGPEILAGLGGLGAAGGEAAAAGAAGDIAGGLSTIGPGVGTAAFADPTAAALAGTGVGAGAVGAPGASAALGFGGTLADAGPFTGLPADLTAADTAGTVPTSTAAVTAGLPPDIAGIPPDINPALFQIVGGAGGESGPTVASTLTGDYGAGAFPAAPAAVPSSVFGPAPTPFDPGMGASPIAYGGIGSPAGAAAGAPAPGLMDQLGLTGIGNFAKNNAGMLGLLGLSAGAQLLNANKGLPYSQQQLAAAQQAGQFGGAQSKFAQAAEQPLITGQLPPGQQAAVSQGLQDAIATIKGRYAAMDLTGSTMEADAIAHAQEQSVIEGVKIEQAMAQTGVQAASSAVQALGLESNVYNSIMNAVLSQDQGLANAISGFANAASFGTAIGQARAPAAVA
jgi:hypothetical protein